MKEYDIEDSIPKVGHLYPVLKDAHGSVIDGFHRLQHDPFWPVKQLTDIILKCAPFLMNATVNLKKTELLIESWKPRSST